MERSNKYEEKVVLEASSAYYFWVAFLELIITF